MTFSLSAGGSPAHTVDAIRQQAESQKAADPAAAPVLDAAVALVEAKASDLAPNASMSVSVSFGITSWNPPQG